MRKDSEHPQGGKAGMGGSFFVLCFGVFMVYLDSMIVNVALPDIRMEMEIGLRGLQWVVDAYLIPFACLLLTAGVIGDTFGHKKMFLLGMAGFTLSSAWCAESATLDSLLAARAVQGAFGALMIPVSLAIIRSSFPTPSARAKAIGIWAGIGGIALAAGPIVGGLLVESFGWESVFWLNVPIGAVVFAFLAAKLKETVMQTSRSLDLVGQGLAVLAIASLSYGLIESHARGWGDPRILVCLGASLIAIVLFVFWERRSRQPLLPMDFFRQPIFIAALLVNFLAFFSVFVVSFLMTLYLQNVNGLSAFETGLRFLPLTLALMVASMAGSRLAVKVSPAILIPAGSFAVGASLLWLTGLTAGSGPAHYAWPLLLLGISLPIAGTSATVALMNGITADRAGMASGIANTFRQISSVVAVALSGTLVSASVKSASGSLLASLSIPEAWRPNVQEAMAAGNLDILRHVGLPSGSLDILEERTPHWFVQGLHDAFLLAAAAAFVCAFAGLAILARKTRTRSAEGASRAANAVPVTAANE